MISRMLISLSQAGINIRISRKCCPSGQTRTNWKTTLIQTSSTTIGITMTGHIIIDYTTSVSNKQTNKQNISYSHSVSSRQAAYFFVVILHSIITTCPKVTPFCNKFVICYFYQLLFKICNQMIKIFDKKCWPEKFLNFNL